MEEKPTLGFIGLGLMGQPMATNLIDAGYRLVVHNRSQQAVDDLVRKGATPAFSPVEVATQSEIVILCLPDSPDVQQVIAGPDGILEGASAGDIIIDMSTISPVVVRELAQQAAERNVHVLDAPVSGGPHGAETGTLSIMIGGERKLFEQCLPIIRVLGENISYMGSIGMGQTAKLANQIVGQGTLLAVAEGLRFAERAGLDLQQVYDIMQGGAASSWQLKHSGAQMLDNDWAPGFRVTHALKDMRLVLETAEELDLQLTGAKATSNIYQRMVDQGYEDRGIQAAFLAIRGK